MFGIPWNYIAAGGVALLALFGDKLVPGLKYAYDGMSGFFASKPSVPFTYTPEKVTDEDAFGAEITLAKYLKQGPSQVAYPSVLSGLKALVPEGPST